MRFVLKIIILEDIFENLLISLRFSYTHGLLQKKKMEAPLPCRSTQGYFSFPYILHPIHYVIRLAHTKTPQKTLRYATRQKYREGFELAYRQYARSCTGESRKMKRDKQNA